MPSSVPSWTGPPGQGRSGDHDGPRVDVGRGGNGALSLRVDPFRDLPKGPLILGGFEGSLVTLRSIESDDAAQLHGVLGHRDLSGRRYLEHEHTGPLGQAEVKKQIDAWQEQRTGLALAVTSRRGRSWERGGRVGLGPSQCLGGGRHRPAAGAADSAGRHFHSWSTGCSPRRWSPGSPVG